MNLLTRDQFDDLIGFLDSEQLTIVDLKKVGDIEVSCAEVNMERLKTLLVGDNTPVPIMKEIKSAELLSWLAKNGIEFVVPDREALAIRFSKDGEIVHLGASLWVWKRGKDVNATIYDTSVAIKKAINGVDYER